MPNKKLECKAMILDKAKNINGQRVKVHAINIDEAHCLLEK